MEAAETKNERAAQSKTQLLLVVPPLPLRRLPIAPNHRDFSGIPLEVSSGSCIYCACREFDFLSDGRSAEMSSWLRCKNSLRFIGPSQAGEINLPEPFRDGEEFSESRVFSNVLKKDLRASDLHKGGCVPYHRKK